MGAGALEASPAVAGRAHGAVQVAGRAHGAVRVAGRAHGAVQVAGRAHGTVRVAGRALVQVLPAWIVSRVLVAVSLALAHGLVSTVRPGDALARLRVHQGLLAWDGGWYASIAGHGYRASGVQSVRFFPAFPLAGRALARVPGLDVGSALVILSNLCALAALAALLVLVTRDLGDPALARRSVWLLALAPSAYVFSLGYADGPLLACAVVVIFGARTGRWWTAAAAGLVAGALRPVGILLVVPVLVEVWRVVGERRASMSTGSRPPSAWWARGSAVAAPVVGAAAFLWWVDSRFGSPWLPFQVQEERGHRGGFSVPLAAMWHNAASVLHGHHLGSALHIPWVLLCVVLLVVAFRRLPLSYGAFAAAVLAVSLTSSNLDSFERYAVGAFPLVVAASTLTSRRRVELVVLVASAVAMTAYAFLAFVGVVVP